MSQKKCLMRRCKGRWREAERERQRGRGREGEAERERQKGAIVCPDAAGFPKDAMWQSCKGCRED